MAETITVGLTSWQASIATFTLLVAICSLAWTIHSKLEDWKIARDDKREKQQTEATNIASTAKKLVSLEERIAGLEKNLQRELERVTKDAESVDNARQKTLFRLNDRQTRMDARLEELEKNKCKCNLTKSNDIDPLAAKIIELDTVKMKLSTIKPCLCVSKIPRPVLSRGRSRQRTRLYPSTSSVTIRSCCSA